MIVIECWFKGRAYYSIETEYNSGTRQRARVEAACRLPGVQIMA